MCKLNGKRNQVTRFVKCIQINVIYSVFIECINIYSYAFLQNGVARFDTAKNYIVAG